MNSSKRGAKSEMPPPPPPPPAIPPNFVPQKAVVTRVPMARRGFASRGKTISLLTNHFKVALSKTDGHFYHYSVSIKYEDDSPADAKGIGRRVLDKVHDTYVSELAGKRFAYDGEKSLFTVGALPRNKLEFTVVLEEISSNRNLGSGSHGADGSPDETDRKRSRRPRHSKMYKVSINYASKIPMQAIANALRGQDSEHFQEAVRVLDIILRQHAAEQGCLLVRQSFFHNEPRNFIDLGGGVVGCRGFHSSFRATQGGLSLNMDVSTTMIVKPGPVIDFLLMNQKVDNPAQIDWTKAKRTLKNLRIKAVNSNIEYKISGLSDRICREQKFPLKIGGKGTSEAQEEITVYDYFLHHRNIRLRYSADFPCINVGKPKRPTYIPLELCSLVSLQRYTKALSNLQRASLVEKSRQKPTERMNALKQAFTSSNYAADPLLGSSGISISTEFTRIQGRVLAPPKLRVGSGVDFVPRNGRWNFNNKRLVEPIKLERWAVVNFSSRCDMRNLSRELARCGQMKGISIKPPFQMFEENPQFRHSPAPIRVDEMIATMKSGLPGEPQFLLCILPERKNSDVYGPWKRKNLSDLGIVTQCIAPTRINDQYLTNVLLKINAKLGGINSLLTIEHTPSIPLISSVPTLIVGMDVSHGSPGRSDVPSIAAVVSSRQWPLISKYRAAVRTQSPKMEMIDSLFKKVSDTEDHGIFREALQDFYTSSKQRKPDQIIIFRDGVSESQFSQVLNVELEQIMEACKLLDESWHPKFMVVVAQKNHHTKFFQANSADNVPPGTVIDNGICHPRSNDFYMCAHAGMIGTTRPTHYHVLYDELDFSPDDLQELVHSLSYVYQRSTTAISVVAPICYAHLAAAQMAQFIKFEEASDRSSSHSGTAAGGGVSVQELPRLHDRISSSMFFC
ncbi:UNVERIFIED_CONTAM: protein argonaute 4A [Sesamum latifolium]|uniref:Protein argonaute 4A n=1 Tax=Sesamum latifolium TaxID=2727402 RepID=A0AAW2XSL6_9LAMI